MRDDRRRRAGDFVRGHSIPLSCHSERRVAVAVELQGLPWLTFVTAHLDTRGRIQGRSGRMVQATELARHLDNEWGTDQTIVVGADLNSYFGARERMFAGFRGAGFQRLALEGRPRHTFHARGLRMLLDHVLVRNAEASIAAVKVMRLDESQDDGGRYIFGSDHHPLLARLEFAPRHRRIKRS